MNDWNWWGLYRNGVLIEVEWSYFHNGPVGWKSLPGEGRYEVSKLSIERITNE